MTAHTSRSTGSIDRPQQADPPSPVSRGWLVAGLAAAVTSIAGLIIGSGVDAVYADASKNDPERIAAAILDSAGTIAVFHTATAAAALLLVVFAAGLRLFLARRTPDASILPHVASAGLLLTATVQIIGTSLDTDFSQGARGNVTPDAITFYGHWVNTIPWYWAGAGLTGLALAIAGFRYGALPRWLALVSLVLGGATTLFAVSPLEYLAAMTGALWLLVVTVALLTRKRARTPLS